MLASLLLKRFRKVGKAHTKHKLVANELSLETFQILGQMAYERLLARNGQRG